MPRVPPQSQLPLPAVAASMDIVGRMPVAEGPVAASMDTVGPVWVAEGRAHAWVKATKHSTDKHDN